MEADNSSKKNIFKSTAIVGGSQLAGIIIGIARNKVIALLIGPVGVGLIGLFQGIIDVVKSSTNLGVAFGAVRDIAEADSGKVERGVSRVIAVLNKWIWITGIAGMLIMLIFSSAIGRFTFDTSKYNIGVAVLSVTILLTALTSGKLAVLQGLRRLYYLAVANFSAILIGFLISVPLYWFLGLEGIVPSLIVNSVSAFAIAYWLSAKAGVPRTKVSLTQALNEGRGMVRLGSYTVITSISSAVMLYVIRYLLINRVDIEGVGYFQASWLISYVYVSSILYAMSADYYPRLSAVKNSNVSINKLVNEQIEVGMLIATPLLVFLLSLISLLVPVLYSRDFVAAIPILQWQLIGSFLKVLSFPITYILLVRDRGGYYIATEVLRDILYIALIRMGWQVFGLEIAGLAFLVVYLIHFITVYAICSRLYNVKLLKKNIKFLLLSLLLSGLAYLNIKFSFSDLSFLVGGIILTIMASYFSYRVLKELYDIRSLLRKLFKGGDR